MAIAILTLLALAAARLDEVATRQVAGNATIADGDSLTILGERIRLRGIDAPELKQQCRRDGHDYACGEQARRMLAQLADGQTVTCTGWERDAYDRLLARCEAAGRDLGRAMVEAGWAIAYGDHAGSEAEARSAGRGLWAGTFEDPRDWRTRQRAAQERPHDRLGQVVNFLKQLLLGGGAA